MAGELIVAQGGRWLRVFGTAGLMFACAVGSSRLILADGAVSIDGTAGPSGKPNNVARPERNAASAKAHAATTKITPEREAAAIAFAGQNHPELATLLTNLKQNNPTEYRAAVADLDRIVERLASLKQKNVQQHDSELVHWKMDSRIRLLAARLTMSDNPALEAELKAAVRERVELTLAERRAERERLQKRVEKLDQTIGELSTKLDDVAEKELAAVKRSVQSNRPTAKSKLVRKGEENAIAKPVERTTNNKDKSGAKSPLKDPNPSKTQVRPL
jgi:hypothetical protein